MSNSELRDPALSILTVLAGGRRHGYAIIKEAEELSDGRVRLKVSSLYATLDRLQSDGLVERAGDEAVDGRLRRYFSLTEAGADVLRRESERLEAQARIARERLAARQAAVLAGGTMAIAGSRVSAGAVRLSEGFIANTAPVGGIA